MSYFTPNQSLNSLFYVLPYKLKVSLHPVHLLLIKTICLKSMTLKSSLVNLKMPRSSSYPIRMALFRLIPKTGIFLFYCLTFFMSFLQKTTNTFLIFMENLMTLQLRNIYKSLSISLTSLRYSMMMFVWGLFPNLCKEMLRNGLNICNLNPSIHGKSFLIYFWGFVVRGGHWTKYF